MSLQFSNVIGHRGAKGVILENTLESFELAMKSNIKWVELDVMLSKDDVPMVFHDETLDRLCETKGRLDSFTCDELKSFKLKDGHQIPTLVEVLTLLNTYEGCVNIEIKPSRKELARKTASIACKTAFEKGFDDPSKLLFSSFDWEALEETFAIARHIPRGVLVEETSEDWRPFARIIQAFSINYDFDLLTDTLIAEILNDDYNLLVYTVNDPAEAKTLISKGVTAVFSDFPVEITNALKPQICLI